MSTVARSGGASASCFFSSAKNSTPRRTCGRPPLSEAAITASNAAATCRGSPGSATFAPEPGRSRSAKVAGALHPARVVADGRCTRRRRRTRRPCGSFRSSGISSQHRDPVRPEPVGVRHGDVEPQVEHVRPGLAGELDLPRAGGVRLDEADLDAVLLAEPVDERAEVDPVARTAPTRVSSPSCCAARTSPSRSPKPSRRVAACGFAVVPVSAGDARRPSSRRARRRRARTRRAGRASGWCGWYSTSQVEYSP